MATPRLPFLPWLRLRFALPLVALPALLTLLAPGAAMASDGAPAAGPPASYQLDAVALRLLRQPAQGQPKQALQVAGSGSASLDAGRPAVTHTFLLPAGDVIALLNGLYRLRFFDLPAELRARPSVFLLPDGSVGTQVAKRMDTTSTTVCVTLPGYEKCVRYAEGDGPPELEAWAQAALADARRRTAPTAPGK